MKDVLSAVSGGRQLDSPYNTTILYVGVREGARRLFLCGLMDGDARRCWRGAEQGQGEGMGQVAGDWFEGLAFLRLTTLSTWAGMSARCVAKRAILGPTTPAMNKASPANASLLGLNRQVVSG